MLPQRCNRNHKTLNKPMFKRRKSRFSESELSRQKPRRKLFRALLTGKPSRHHAHAVAHDDNRRISLSIKVILLLLVLHIVALAATGLHSQFTDNQEPAAQVGNEAATPPRAGGGGGRPGPAARGGGAARGA